MSEEEKTTDRMMISREEDLSSEEVLERANTAMKDRWLGILIQLHNSPRYCKFLDNNFIIRDVVDEEQKTIETQVIVKPTAVGPSLTAKQIYKLRQALEMQGCNDIDDAFNAVMRVLGQEEEASGIVLSSDVNAAEASQEKMKRKLDA